MNKLTHWIAHKFGWNTGEVAVFWRGARLMVGFRCDGCGTLSGVHESVTTRSPESCGLPPYPIGEVVGPCVCGSWPGGECLRCPVIVTPNAKVSGGGAFPPSV
jgi:hypothetical protein